jgi:vacuolar-type H+-ATPase subunit E/Vma4
MQFGSIEAVVLAVQEDAKADVEKIERDLATTIARLREEDAALPVVVPDANARIAAARRQGRDRIAAEDWADRQAALSNRETWIQRVTAEGERKLRALDPAVLRADLVDLVREALDRMPNQPLELLVPAEQIDLAEPILGDPTLAAPGKVVTRVGVTSEVTSGCIVQSADGRIRYDNSYGIRARRFEVAWRARLGELYEQRLEPALAGGSSSRNDVI